MRYIASIWLNATDSSPPDLSPEDLGWLLEDGYYQLKWFDGEAAPKAIDIMCEDQDPNIDDDEGEDFGSGADVITDDGVKIRKN